MSLPVTNIKTFTIKPLPASFLHCLEYNSAWLQHPFDRRFYSTTSVSQHQKGKLSNMRMRWWVGSGTSISWTKSYAYHMNHAPDRCYNSASSLIFYMLGAQKVSNKCICMNKIAHSLQCLYINTFCNCYYNWTDLLLIWVHHIPVHMKYFSYKSIIYLISSFLNAHCTHYFTDALTLLVR